MKNTLLILRPMTIIVKFHLYFLSIFKQESAFYAIIIGIIDILFVKIPSKKRPNRSFHVNE
jgi:hypothetical protein